MGNFSENCFDFEPWPQEPRGLSERAPRPQRAPTGQLASEGIKWRNRAPGTRSHIFNWTSPV
jgi:hypothetical protein